MYEAFWCDSRWSVFKRRRTFHYPDSHLYLYTFRLSFVWCVVRRNEHLYLQVYALCCLNQRIMSVRIAKRKMSLRIRSYRTVSFATMWIISRMKRATTKAPWGNPDASHTPRLTGIPCKSSGRYRQCSRYRLNLRDLCANSLMHLQVCVFTDLCLSLEFCVRSTASRICGM